MRGSAYLLLVPIFVVLAVIEFYPLVYSAYLSTTGQGGGFVGLSNYVMMLQDGAFWSAVGVSLLYSGGSTVLALALGLLFIYLLSQRPKGRGVFESALIVPLAVAPVVTGVLWSPSSTWDDIDTFTHFILHLSYFNVLSPLFYYPVMILSESWEWAPLIMLVGLSVINSVDRSIFEAASIHGASPLQVFAKVTVPTILKSPVTQFVLVLRFVDAMLSFAIPWAWSSWVGYQELVGSPVDTLSLFLYKLMFIPVYNFPASLIAAVAISLLIVTLLGASALLRLMKALGGVT